MVRVSEAKRNFLLLEEQFADLLDQVADGEINMRVRRNISKVNDMGGKIQCWLSQAWTGTELWEQNGQFPPKVEKKKIEGDSELHRTTTLPSQITPHPRCAPL
jgi:hypothetical protein